MYVSIKNVSATEIGLNMSDMADESHAGNESNLENKKEKNTDDQRENLFGELMTKITSDKVKLPEDVTSKMKELFFSDVITPQNSLNEALIKVIESIVKG
jgi:hypothetical protein